MAPRSATTRLSALLPALALGACSRAPGSRGAEAPTPAPVEALLSVVERGVVQRHVRATGTLFGEEHATIAAKVAGRIDAVWRDVGDVVAPGDRLARVEARDYDLIVHERTRAFDEALSQLGIDELPEGGFDVDALPTVERARLQAENARARYERGRRLHDGETSTMSEQDFADLKTAWDVAQAEHRLAMLNARAQLAQARTLRALLATAQQRLADTLHAVPRGERPAPPGSEPPADPSVEYVVTRRSVSTGDYVQPGAPLFELIDPDPLKLRVAVPEREAARVRVGQRALVRVDTDPGSFEGRVARINFAVEPRSRTFEVEILLRNGERRLRAGSFARTEIEVERADGVLLVPRSAVTRFAGVHKVFAVVDGRAVERAVRLGGETGGRVEIEHGLEAGETIVAEPPPGLTGGTPVRAAGGPAAGGDAEAR